MKKQLKPSQLICVEGLRKSSTAVAYILVILVHLCSDVSILMSTDTCNISVNMQKYEKLNLSETLTLIFTFAVYCNIKEYKCYNERNNNIYLKCTEIGKCVHYCLVIATTEI
jgi:hypothetical protein